MKKYGLRGFILGVFVTLLITMTITPISAAVSKMISVSSGVSIYMDDVKLNPTDANGNPVEVFIYNGTTYMPVRAVSEAIGKAVSWDGATKSVYLGKHDNDTPVAMLYQLEYFTVDNGEFQTEKIKDNYGNDYYNGSVAYDWYGSDRSTEEYLVKGMYSRFAGKVVLQYASRSYDNGFYDPGVLIYADDILVYSTDRMEAGANIMNFDIDLSGVEKLKVTIKTSAVAVVDAGLYQ
jgi:hypothetical protein